MSIDSLLRNIEQAFPKWNDSTDFYPPSITCEQFNELRLLMLRFPTEHLPSVLGLVLYDIALRHDTESDITASVVLDFLNARLVFGNNSDTLGPQELRGKEFLSFNDTQRQVIVQWLQHARLWSVYSNELWKIDEALSYWQHEPPQSKVRIVE